MENTIKKTDGLYCPIRRGTCLCAACALYNDDARACALAADSLQLIVRTAASDAAVDVIKAYGDDRR